MWNENELRIWKNGKDNCVFLEFEFIVRVIDVVWI
jgi:hypothetical protein